MPLTAAEVTVAASGAMTGSSTETQNNTGNITSRGRRLKYTVGTGAGAVNLIWSDTRSVATATNDDIDLNGGGLTNAVGEAVAFAAIKMMLIEAAEANTANIVVQPEPTNGWDTWVGDTSDAVIVQPGEMFLKASPSAAGYVVTATTGDLLRINHGDAATQSYTITLFGLSA